MTTYLTVFIGAGLGGALRHLVNQISTQSFGISFPFGTFIVNVMGSLLMGILISYTSLKGDLPTQIRLLLTTGILGGFTTFSAYTLDIVMIYERGENLLATGYAILSVSLSICAVFAGMWLTRQALG